MELDSNQIAQINPHRYPFALVDRILDYKPGEMAIGRKCVSVNEMQFLGHFPEYHVMPGVLIVEALAQVGCIAILTKEGNEGKLVFFGGVDKCRFKGQVKPGDVVELHCTLTKQRGAIGKGDAKAYVDGKLVCQAELTFAIN